MHGVGTAVQNMCIQSAQWLAVTGQCTLLQPCQCFSCTSWDLRLSLHIQPCCCACCCIAWGLGRPLCAEPSWHSATHAHAHLPELLRRGCCLSLLLLGVGRHNQAAPAEEDPCWRCSSEEETSPQRVVWKTLALCMSRVPIPSPLSACFFLTSSNRAAGYAAPVAWQGSRERRAKHRAL